MNDLPIPRNFSKIGYEDTILNFNIRDFKSNYEDVENDDLNKI